MLLSYFVFYNIFVFPVLLFLHAKGECSFIEPYLANTSIPICSYITNFWHNIFFAQLFFVIIMAILYAKIWTSSERRYPQYTPKPFHKKTH